jgi:hypothetical protein
MMARVERERPELWKVMTENGRIWPSASEVTPAFGRTVFTPPPIAREREHPNLRGDEVAALPAVA